MHFRRLCGELSLGCPVLKPELTLGFSDSSGRNELSAQQGLASNNVKGLILSCELIVNIILLTRHLIYKHSYAFIRMYTYIHTCTYVLYMHIYQNFTH